LTFSFVSYEAKVLLVLHSLDPTLVFEAQLLFFIAVNVFVSCVQLFNGFNRLFVQFVSI
jgi:hypothetical protein